MPIMLLTLLHQWRKMMKTWKARVKIQGRTLPVEVTVTARDRYDARSLLEHQYGKNSLTGDPQLA